MSGAGEEDFLLALGARQRRERREAWLEPSAPVSAAGAVGAEAEIFLGALDHIGEGLAVWDAAPRLLHFNRRLPDLFGLPAMELRPGITAKEFLFLLIDQGIITMRAEEAEAWVEAYVDASIRADRKQEVRLADGTWLSFDWRRLPGAGSGTGAASYVSVFSDITIRKRAQLRLRHAETKYRQIFDNVHEGIIQVTPEGRILSVNRAGASVFGYAAPEQMLREVSNAGRQLYLQQSRRRDLGEQLDRSGYVRDFRSQMRRRDGSVIWVSQTLRRVVDERGQTVMVEGTFRDVSSQRRAEEALMQAKEQAEAANRAKSDFLANMSHELRTPLNAILGFSQILSDGLLGPLGNPKYTEYCRDILASGRHLLALINDILDMAKVEAGKMALDEEWFCLDESLDAALLLVRERAHDNDIVISKALPAQPPTLWGDSRRLRQVWINLLSNAVKFTPPGGRVNVDVSVDEENCVSIAVSDTGIGIAATDIERVLQPFAQVANALSRSHEGTGLGLALTRSLVELHGGRLAIDSEVGIGTTVTVTLPADRLQDRPPVLAAATLLILPSEPSGFGLADAEHQFAHRLALAQPGNGARGTVEGVDFTDDGPALAAD